MPRTSSESGASTKTKTKTKNIRRPRRSALTSRLFRRYFGASCFSTVGTWITRFLLGWTTWDLTHSALWVGIISAVMLLPTFLLSPVFGVISDRISARNGMLCTMSIQAVIGATAALVQMQDQFSISWLVAIAACIGSVSAAHHPMRLALIPKLVDRELLPSAIGLSAIVFNSSRIIGPAIGAWLVAHSSVAMAFWAASSLFGCALLFLISIRSFPVQIRETRHSLLTDLKDGLGFIRASPAIRLVLGLTMINGVLGRSIIELLPAISGRLINGDASALATLTAFAGVGSIGGGVIISRQRGNQRKMINLVMVSLLVGGVVLLPTIAVSALAELTVIILLLSMTTTMVGTGCQALIQLTVDDAYRGRVLSIWTVISMGVPAFGAFLMGAVADLAGFGPIIIIFSIAAMVATLALSHRRNLVGR
jgi:predicted MFS family arabinose efflux permease